MICLLLDTLFCGHLGHNVYDNTVNNHLLLHIRRYNLSYSSCIVSKPFHWSLLTPFNCVGNEIMGQMGTNDGFLFKRKSGTISFCDIN